MPVPSGITPEAALHRAIRVSARGQVLEKAPQAQQAAGFGAATVPCPQTALRVCTPGCLGLALMGSYAKRSGDRVSDLDLVAFLANGAAAAYLEQAHQLLLSEAFVNAYSGRLRNDGAFSKYVFLDFSISRFVSCMRSISRQHSSAIGPICQSGMSTIFSRRSRSTGRRHDTKTLMPIRMATMAGSGNCSIASSG